MAANDPNGIYDESLSTHRHAPDSSGDSICYTIYPC